MPDCSVLLLSPDAALAADLQMRLGPDAGLLQSESFAAARVVMSTAQPQVLLADLRHVIDGGHAADRFLELVQTNALSTRVIVLTGANCPEPIERRVACGGIQRLNGAGDQQEIGNAVRTALQSVANRAAAPAVHGEEPSNGDFADVVLEGVTQRFETNSPALRRMLEDLAVAAAHDVTILLIGETGSGKTFLSKLIHEASPRRNEPFIHVACGALPRELIESELFGHAKGAFTSAHADKEGKFLAAGGGTMLLDEIDVLGPEQQVKLLRVIETREFEPVGSNRTHRSQARLVVASNLDLQPLVEQAKFRPDLYYRLNMMKFELPPLRKRRVDIVPLAKKFIRKFAQQHGVEIQRVDNDFYELLLDYPWPGNVRELEHVVQRAVIYCRGGALTAEQLPPHILLGEAGPTNDPSVKLAGRGIEKDVSLEAQVALTEKDLIEEALLRNNFSRTNTARELGISRVTLYNKMKRYCLMK